MDRDSLAGVRGADLDDLIAKSDDPGGVDQPLHSRIDRDGGVGGGLILAVAGGTIAGVSTALRELLIRHVDAGAIPGGVALLGAGNVEVVTAGVASIGGGPMGEDAIMRIQSMTKAITSVAALRLVEAGHLELDQSLVDWLPELADRQVLRDPAAELDDTVPARGAITLRHLLTNTSGYGMVIQASPLQQAMAANGTEAGPEPPAMGADEWLRRLTELPLAFQPGEGWRYHHSFGVLGVLISRVTGRPLGKHLAGLVREITGIGAAATPASAPTPRCASWTLAITTATRTGCMPRSPGCAIAPIVFWSMAGTPAPAAAITWWWAAIRRRTRRSCAVRIC